MLRGTARQAAAEFLGTFVLITFGVAVVAQVVLSGEKNGSYFSINLGWGLAVVMGIYVSSGVSGAHLNPAVTLTMALFGRFPWRQVIPYFAAQMAGAFLASALVFATYHEAIDHFDGGTRQISGPQGTAGIFATYPQEWLSLAGGLVDQIVGTALLLLCVFGISDARNQSPQSNLGGLLVGLVVLAIGMTFGYNCGYAINPARDLGPRLFTAVAGWGGGVFEAAGGWWWVPVVGPLIGGVLGGLIYELFVGWHHPPEK